MNPAEAIEAGTVLVGKYRIESVLGRGGMGMVYRAHHLALDETIAIKVLRRDVSLDEETVHRFVREAQSAVKLKSEHVARIRDVGTFDDGLPYMVMEYLEGADLGQLVESNGAMNAPIAVDLVLQACDAIAEAHSLGIVHRDIKPTNLFVSFRPDETAIVKVLDFGISKSASGADLSLTQTSSMLGTPAYMSPEQMRSARSVDARTDVWSLGTVLYELVEARRPFNAESFSEMCVMVAVDPPAPMQLAPELESIILRCLQKHPDHRYPNVPELMRELAVFAGNPETARHFVTRAYRVLGLPVPQNLDSNPSMRPVTYQTPVPGLHLSSLALRPANARPTMTAAPSSTLAAMAAPDPRKPNRTLAVVIVSCVLLGVGGAIGYVKVTEEDQTAAIGAPPEVGSVQAGSAEVRTGSNEGSGSSAGSAGSDAGSAVADTATSPAGAREGSATGSGAGSARTGSGAAKVVNVGGKPPRGGGKPPRGGGKPPRSGGSAETGKGSGSAKAGSAAPPKPKCDPFNSVRDGC